MLRSFICPPLDAQAAIEPIPPNRRGFAPLSNQGSSSCLIRPVRVVIAVSNGCVGPSVSRKGKSRDTAGSIEYSRVAVQALSRQRQLGMGRRALRATASFAGDAGRQAQQPELRAARLGRYAIGAH